MTAEEFSNQFDVLYNNITSNQAPGLNEYEKSVFLTKAQDEIVKNYFNPKSNPKQEGFDDTAKRQADFSNLLRTSQLTADTRTETKKFDSRAFYYKIPNEAYIVINEMLETNSGLKQLIPISYSEYTRLMSKPFKRPLKNQAWRLITENEKAVEIILPLASDTVTKYSIRYIVKPKAILLYAPTGDYADLTIDETSVYDADNPCELDSALHEEVLQRAVELAKIAWAGDAQSVLTAGARSE